jgi:lipoprotein-anchoring transpeptidase ErfK/SrfK
MDFRSASIIATLLIGLGGPGCQAFAQYYPYPVSPSPPHGSPPPVDEDGDLRDTATLPPEVRPETGPTKELPPQFRRTLIDYYTTEPRGTIVIDTLNTYLYLVLGDGKALRYGIGVGREGFTWSGIERVSRLAEWPDWHPPEQMIERQSYLPRFMAGGEGNPLGARALYLGDTQIYPRADARNAGHSHGICRHQERQGHCRPLGLSQTVRDRWGEEIKPEEQERRKQESRLRGTPPGARQRLGCGRSDVWVPSARS